MELVPAGLYIFMTMRADVGDCHWGLYLHHSTEVAATSAHRSTTLPPQPPKKRTIYRGKKYHVRNLGGGYMPDHQIVGDMLSTLFLVGLLRVGVIQDNANAMAEVDNIIRALDGEVHNLSKGNSIYCRTWVIGIVRALVEKGNLHTNATDEEIWAHVEDFGAKEWESAERAEQPRPIIISSLFR